METAYCGVVQSYVMFGIVGSISGDDCHREMNVEREIEEGTD